MTDAVETAPTTETATPEPTKQPPAAKSKAKEPEKPHYHVDEFKTGKRDPFTAAFNASQDELRGVDDDPDDEPAPKPVKKPAPAKKEPEPEAKPKKEPKPKPAEAEDDAEDEPEAEAEAEEPAEKVEAKPEKKATGPLEPKKWWASRKRDAFLRMPRHIQESWLAEAPKPDQRWTADEKASFEKMPVEAQELVLARHQEFERGYGEKFETLAKERKLAEEVRKAVPPQLRTLMDQRGLTEAQVLNKLAQQQLFALQDPKGYARKFLADAKINPLDVFQFDAEGQPVAQPQQQAAPDIRAHPDYQAMAAELQQLREERQKLAATDEERFSAEFESLLNETDGEGNSPYPFIRVLAGAMATIIENEPDRYSGLSLKDRLAASYFEALEDFPELSAIQMTAPKPAPADEPKPKSADSDGEGERVAKLEKAVTPKSRAPAPASAPNTAGDPFEQAWASARKSLRM